MLVNRNGLIIGRKLQRRKKKKNQISRDVYRKRERRRQRSAALPMPAPSPWWLQLPFVALTRRAVCSAAAEVQRRFLPTLLTTHNFFLHWFLFQKRRVNSRSAAVTDGRLEKPSSRGAGRFSHKQSARKPPQPAARRQRAERLSGGDNGGATEHHNVGSHDGECLFDNSAHFHSVFLPFLKNQNKPHLKST